MKHSTRNTIAALAQMLVLAAFLAAVIVLGVVSGVNALHAVLR